MRSIPRDDQFQSPIRRGSRGNYLAPIKNHTVDGEVSVPYSSGQPWQQGNGPASIARGERFSPLFVGAAVAT